MATAAQGRATAGVRLGLRWPGRTPLTGQTPLTGWPRTPLIGWTRTPLRGWTPLQRLSARLRGPWLDRELAAGVPPWHSPAHSVRSLQITAPRARRALARSLEKLLTRAAAPPPPSLSAVVPLDRPAVLAAQPLLKTLVQRLRDGTPISPEGVAALRDVVADGSGPLYSALSGAGLGRVLASIHDALDVPG